MALSERLAYILDFDVRGGVKSLEQVGKTADKELQKVGSGVDKVGANLTKFGVGAMGFAGVVGTALFKTAGEASDLSESVNAVNVTFGTSAEGIKQLGEEAARSVGLANSEFNGLAVQFSSFTQTVAGSQGRDVVAVMDELTTRTADFASVMNLDVPEAARVFQSALSGETEPIKKFGIDLSAAAVEQYALANGLIKTKAELTETIKVQARYGLLMEETAKTQGDFANTADGAANQQRILRAEMKNAAAEIGEGVLPAMTQLMSLVGRGVGLFNDLNDATGGNVGTIATWGVAIVGAIGGLSALAGQLIKARDSITGFATNMTAAKTALVTTGIVIGTGIALYQTYAGAKEAATARTNEFVQALKDEKAGQKGASDALLIAEFSQDKYAKTLEKLGVSVADVVRAVKGEQIPALDDLTDRSIAAAIDGNNDYAGGLTELSTQIDLMSDGLRSGTADFNRQTEATSDLARETEMYTEFADAGRAAVEGLGGAADEAAEGVDALNISMTGTDSSAQQIDNSIRAAKSRLDRFGEDGVEQMGDLEDATEDATEAFADLKAEIAGRTAWRDLEQAFEEVGNAANLAWTSAAEGADDAAANARDYDQSIDDARLAVIDYAEEVGNVPTEVMTDIQALIDEGKYAEALARLAELERDRVVRLRVDSGQVNPNRPIAPGRNYAQGTQNHPGGPATFNEAGREIAVFPDGTAFMSDMPAGTKVFNERQMAAGGAGGGIASSARSAPTSVTNIYNHYEIHGVGPEQAADIIMSRQQRQIRGMR